MLAAIYLRESDAELSRPDRYGLPEQLRAASQVLTEESLELVKEYVDEEADSAELDRPALNELRADMRTGLFQVLIVPRVDRLARDVALGNFLYHEAQQYGVEVIFAAPDERTIDNTPEGQVMLTLRLYAAAKYRQSVKAQTQNARHARARSGKPIPGHHILYGYQWADGKKTRAVVNEVHAKVIREMFQRVADGEPIQRVAASFTEQHIPSPGGKARKWWPEHIVRLLKRREYIGEAVAYRTVTTKVRRKLANGGTKRVEYTAVRPEDDPKRVVLPEGVYPPIVDRELFDRVQARLERNRQESQRHNPEPEATLLRAGIAVCGYCGKPLSAVRQPKATAPGGQTWDYACRRKECPSRGIATRAEVLDTEVWQTVVRMALDAQWLWEQAEAWERTQVARMVSAEHEVGPLERRLRDLERKQANVRAAIADAAIPEVRALLTHDLSELVAESKRVTQWLDQAKGQASDANDRAEAMRKMAIWVTNQFVKITTGKLTYDERRDLLTALDIRVIVWRKDHTPRWTIVFGWSTFLVQRLEQPDAIPLPVGPLPEVPLNEDTNAAALGAIALRSDRTGVVGELAQGYMEGWIARAHEENLALVEATVTNLPDQTQFARDLDPAVAWATQWLTRPKPAGANWETHNQ